MDIPRGSFLVHCFLVELEFRMLILWRKENLRTWRKALGSG